MNTYNASHLVWRPQHPSENLKTPRFVQTCSTINPYATHETQSPQQASQQQASQQQASPQQASQQQASQQASPYIQDLQHSKRENNSDKIYERGLTPQVGMNPFLKGNYLQDLETQNQFLKPLNSNLK